MVHLEHPDNDKLHHSLLDRHIMSKLFDFKTKSYASGNFDETNLNLEIPHTHGRTKQLLYFQAPL